MRMLEDRRRGLWLAAGGQPQQPAQVVGALGRVLANQGEVGRADKAHSWSETSVGYGLRFGMNACYRSGHTKFITPSSQQGGAVRCSASLDKAFVQ